MTSNEVVLIDRLIADAQQNREVPYRDDIAFEIFAAEGALHGENLTDEEIEAGRIGGGNDGGIDAVYVFLDGVLLDEDSELFSEGFTISKVRKNVALDIRLVQAKREQSFTETALDKAASSLERLLDLSQTDEQLSELYSSELIARIRLFTNAWTLLGIRAPQISATFAYVSKGDVASVGTAVIRKQRDLEGLFRMKIPGCNTATVRLLGARELWNTASAVPEYDLQLRFEDYVSKGDSYSGLVSLREYFKFLEAENGGLRGHLFDWNVRDYQGGVTVNKGIKHTLEEPKDEDFWWLNNGVTILCSSIVIGGDKTFTLSSVQIVNGMQTSQAIYTAVRDIGADATKMKDRSVLVRIIKTQDEEVRDTIIRATNSQTKVSDASLHATENIHRQIEAHFIGHGWFYDRRKNYYKNAGKPADRIISISALGQAVMAIGLGRPNDARARPSSLLNSAEDYGRIFSEKVPLDIYLWIVSLQRKVDGLLQNDADLFVRSNLRFHVSAYIATLKFREKIYSPRQLKELAKEPVHIEQTDTWNALTTVEGMANDLANERMWAFDRVAKSATFADMVTDRAAFDGLI